MKTSKLLSGILTIILSIILIRGLYAHDDGHKSPKALPPIGPHGGKYSKLTKHFGEVVVKDNQVTVYILEKDIKNVAEDATKVSATLEIPGKLKKKLNLVKEEDGEGYIATIAIPKSTRRVYFHIQCMLDEMWENGKILYEPRR